MKGTKKILAGFLAATMILGSTVVWAAGSRTSDVTVPEEAVGTYVTDSKIEEAPSFQKLVEEEPEVAKVIEEVNKGEIEVVDFVEELKKVVADENLPVEAKESIENVIKVIEEKELDFVTGFFDLEWEEDAEKVKNENGNYDVTLSVPSMTDTMKDIALLHYSTERKLWEVIEVENENIDPEKKTITAEFIDFSPVAVVANVEEAEELAEENNK